MPYNGSGVFSPPGASFPAVPATVIDSAKYNAVINDLAVGLTTAYTKDGQTVATANHSMGGFKHTNVANGTALNHYATLQQLQRGVGLWCGTSGGSLNAQTLTPAIACDAYAAGESFCFIAGFTNTSALTVSVSGLATRNVFNNGQALVGGEVLAGRLYRVTDDGTQMHLEALSTEVRFGVDTISGNTTLTVADVGRKKVITATAQITLPAASTLQVGEEIEFKSTTTGDVTLVRAGADTIDGQTSYRLPSYCACSLVKTGAATYVLFKRPDTYVGDVKLMSLTGTHVGWEPCDGAALSRTTYAGLNSLYSVASYPFGNGDASLTFNVPNLLGRTPVGAGSAGATTEDVTASSGNGFTVASNNKKWITGMPVVLSNLSGFTTGATEGPTYYIYRASATNVRLCSTLAIAQNATTGSMVTISGTGTCTLTSSLQAKALGEVLGEEDHAMSVSELLSHGHGVFQASGNYSAGGNAPWDGTPGSNRNTLSTGGNVAMNNTQPSLGMGFFVKT